jgi:hypothetical protein
VARAGIAAALLVAIGGWTAERYRFGSTDQEAAARVEIELRQRFEASAEIPRFLPNKAGAPASRCTP